MKKFIYYALLLTFMKRKLVKQGAATMTISLPSTWIKKFHVKEGDEIDVNESGNILEISTEKATSFKKIELDHTSSYFFTKNNLTQLYMLGYDEIIIHFKDDTVPKQINERVSECIGFEVIDQSEEKIVVKSISSGLEEEFDTILRKVFLSVKEIGESVYKALKNKEFSRLKQIRQMETINNKFAVFLMRLLSKKGYKDPDRTSQAYDMIQNLERTADEYKYICDSYIDHKKTIDKQVLALLKELNEYYEVVYSLFYVFDTQKRKIIYQDRKVLKNKAMGFLKNNKEIILSHHLIMLSERIYNTAGSCLTLHLGSKH